MRAHWKLCASDGSCPRRGHRDGQNIQKLPTLSVPAPGEYRLHVWLEDAAGMPASRALRSQRPCVSTRNPPSLPSSRWTPPTPCVSWSTRSTGTPVSRAEKSRCAPRGTTTWHGLATDREGSLLVAHVDDERFRKGAYEFRAHAVDQAGNEASTGRRADGSAATLRLPARIDTRLAVGVPRTIVRRRVERRNGHRRLVRRRIRRLDSNVIARHGRAIRLSGFLANADGQPIEGATIEALESSPTVALCQLDLQPLGPTASSITW